MKLRLIKFCFIFSLALAIWIITLPHSYAESLESPRKQMAHGISPHEVKCKTGLELIIKIRDGSAACVKPSTIDRLVTIKWGISAVEKNVETISPPSQVNITKTTPPTQPQPNITKTVPPPQTNITKATPPTQPQPNITKTTPPTTPQPNITKTIPPTPPQISTSKINLGFLSGGNPDMLKVFEENLRDGDYLFLSTPLGDDSKVQLVLDAVEDVKAKVKPGVKVYSLVWYAKIDDIESRVSNLPKGIDWVVYDFEKGPRFTPEYTEDQQKAIEFFDRGLKIAHENGFKFMVTPTYGSISSGKAIGRDWDWGEVAKHMDGLNIQFQGFFKLSNADELKDDMKNITNKISEKSSNTLTFVQLAILTPVGGTVDENINAMDELHSKGINKFFIFYGSPQPDVIKELLTKRK